MQFKKDFLDRYSEWTDIDKFIEYSKKPARKSIRVNTLKTSIKEIRSRFPNLKQIPWCKEGFWIEGMSIGNLPEHFLGYIYLQEAASMIPPLVLNPKENDTVLDICAAPGSKTTQMAAMMKNNGLIVANDNSISRLKPLSINLQRCGVSNTVMTLMSGRWFKTNFDKILVDVPCSGLGTIRKSYSTVEQWHMRKVRQVAGVQKQLLDTAFSILNEEGTLVYSTCTIEPEENEAVVDYLLKKYDNAKIEKIKLNVKSSPPIIEMDGRSFDKSIKNCLRIWPQDNDTDGFFIAKLKKQ